jgi:quinol monooxygenase YgiN
VSSRRLFIYFRVARESEAAVVATVRELHAAWQATVPDLHCELLRRADNNGGDVTLMETYSQSSGISAALQERIERKAQTQIGPWLTSQRHVEVFEPCA